MREEKNQRRSSASLPTHPASLLYRVCANCANLLSATEAIG
jgi:hypothetical protein